MDIYNRYTNYISSIVQQSTLDLTKIPFKSHPSYQYMLEHVSYNISLNYFELYKQHFDHVPIECIIEIIKENDALGCPHKEFYKEIQMYCNPSNFRYLYQALLILKYISENQYTSINIVEIGGGYGGLCLYVSRLSQRYDIIIPKYVIIDLCPIAKLQQEYLKNMSNVTCLSNIDYLQSIENFKHPLFLISNYCLSEIEYHNRLDYSKNLLPLCDLGFIIWNVKEIDIPLNIEKIEIENPLTGPHNKYIYFNKNSKIDPKFISKSPRRHFDKYSNNYLVESGTFMGNGIEDALNCGFKYVISYEVYYPLYLTCQNKFKNLTNVRIYNKSSTYLWDEIKEIDESITFWLDGHYSGSGTGHDGKTYCPLMQELDAIARHPIKTHTILIDDRRLLIKSDDPFLFNTTEDDVVAKLKTINPDYTIIYEDGHIKDDVIVAVIKQ